MPHVALLGPSTLLDRCGPTAVDGLGVVRLDGPATAEALAAERADVVVAFEPSADELAALAAVDLPALLWWEDAPPAESGTPPGRDADGRRRTIAGSAQAPMGLWRSVALPVADEWFGDPGALTEDQAGQNAVAVNFDDEDGPASTHRALVALARGQLLVSEPLKPSRGLEPGIDYVEVRDPAEVRAAVENAVRAPSAFLRMRLRGRRKAELFRSSRVVARLVGDLLRELDLAPVAR